MKKLLIIEDDPIVAKIYRDRLQAEGFAVEVAADGQAGFYRIHEIRPDAILLDLMLPGMNGVDILRKIRAQKQFRQVPVIVFSNAYVADMVHEAIEAGATLVFNKASATPRDIADALNESLFPRMPSALATHASTPSGVAANPAPVALSAETPFHDSRPPRSHAPPAPTPRAQAGPAPTIGTPAPGPGNNGAGIKTSAQGHQTGLREGFLNSAPQVLSSLRNACQAFVKSKGEARLPHLLEMYRRVHSLTGNAGPAGFSKVAQMASALEALLKELHERPKNINASSLRTVEHAVDFLGVLFERTKQQPIDTSMPPLVLVVDDEIISRRTLGSALERAKLKSINLDDPAIALKVCEENRFDLIFLDVDMPSLNGFELCGKIRKSAVNKTTPVVFVTNLTDFENRARSALSGGNDLIGKPFLLVELGVKALTLVLESQLNESREATAPPAQAVANAEKAVKQ